MEVRTTRRGRPLLCLGGYEYLGDVKNDKYAYWHCVGYISGHMLSCPGRASCTRDKDGTLENGRQTVKHNHDPKYKKRSAAVRSVTAAGVQLKHDGFSYKWNREDGAKEFWLCLRAGCPGSIVIRPNELKKPIHNTDHNHLSSQPKCAKCERKKNNVWPSQRVMEVGITLLCSLPECQKHIHISCGKTDSSGKNQTRRLFCCKDHRSQYRNMENEDHEDDEDGDEDAQDDDEDAQDLSENHPDEMEFPTLVEQDSKEEGEYKDNSDEDCVSISSFVSDAELDQHDQEKPEPQKKDSEEEPGLNLDSYEKAAIDECHTGDHHSLVSDSCNDLSQTPSGTTGTIGEVLERRGTSRRSSKLQNSSGPATVVNHTTGRKRRASNNRQSETEIQETDEVELGDEYLRSEIRKNNVLILEAQKKMALVEEKRRREQWRKRQEEKEHAALMEKLKAEKALLEEQRKLKEERGRRESEMHAAIMEKVQREIQQSIKKMKLEMDVIEERRRREREKRDWQAESHQREGEMYTSLREESNNRKVYFKVNSG